MYRYRISYVAPHDMRRGYSLPAYYLHYLLLATHKQLNYSASRIPYPAARKVMFCGKTYNVAHTVTQYHL